LPPSNSDPPPTGCPVRDYQTCCRPRCNHVARRDEHDGPTAALASPRSNASFCPGLRGRTRARRLWPPLWPGTPMATAVPLALTAAALPRTVVVQKLLGGTRSGLTPMLAPRPGREWQRPGHCLDRDAAPQCAGRPALLRRRCHGDRRPSDRQRSTSGWPYGHQPGTLTFPPAAWPGYNTATCLARPWPPGPRAAVLLLLDVPRRYRDVSTLVVAAAGATTVPHGLCLRRAPHRRAGVRASPSYSASRMPQGETSQ